MDIHYLGKYHQLKDYVQGSIFQFHYMYALPHPVKKCIVLYVRGLLYFVNPNLGPSSPDAPFWNIFHCLGVTKLFVMLLEKFHIRLLSSMTKSKLFPLLQHIFVDNVIESLSFIFSKEDYQDFKNYLYCYKMCDILLMKTISRALCAKDQILSWMFPHSC